MEESVSLIINGVRYDAVRLKNAPMTNVCKYCDLYIEKRTSECLKLKACPLFHGYIFKKSDKKFEL